MSCEYSLDILPVIVAFVRSCASVCGASELELSSFELAAEETAAHVIENFPEPTPNDRFSISCRDCDNGVEFNFEDRGVPMNPEIILQYDLTDIDEYPDKLRFLLVKNVCDRLEFRNLSNEGWSILFFKTIKNFRKLPAVLLSASCAPAKKEKIEVVRGTKEDIPALISLTYYTFRYTHYHEYYTPEGFATMMDNPYHVFDLVKTKSGRVVGYQDYAIDPHVSTEICHYGTVMTHPDYRNSTALLRLTKKLAEHLDNPPHPNVRFWLLLLVTTHTGSQRFAEAFNCSTCGIQLSHDIVIQYTGEIKSAGQRETLLISWHWLTKYHGGTVSLYSVPEHADIIRQIFSSQHLDTKITVAKFIPAPEFRATEKYDEYNKYLTITIETFSSDEEVFSLFLRRKKEKAIGAGTKTVYARIPAWMPLPEYISTCMKANGFFFTGIEPRSSSEFYLLYCCLCAQDFDFEKIRLCDQRSKKLLNYARNEYIKVN